MSEVKDDTESVQVELMTAIEEATERRRIVTSHDGWSTDEETGEIVGYEHLPQRFEIKDEESADWVLELRSRLEGEVVGLEARRDALVRQVNAMIGERHRQLAWWDWRFRPGLIEFARKCLKGATVRTKKFAWGQVAFRKSQGTREIIDQNAAIGYVQGIAPELVKIKVSVDIKAVLKARELWAEAAGETGGEPERLAFLVESGPGENITISTGIGIDKPNQKGIS